MIEISDSTSHQKKRERGAKHNPISKTFLKLLKNVH